MIPPLQDQTSPSLLWRGLILTLGFLVVAACSYDSDEWAGVKCGEDGAVDDGRVCHQGFWVIDESTDSTPPSTDTGSSAVPNDTDPAPEPTDTAPAPESEDTGPTPDPTDTAPTPEPEDTGPTPEPNDTGPTPEPEDTGPTPEPNDTGPTPEPEDTGPTPEPEDTGPAGCSNDCSEMVGNWEDNGAVTPCCHDDEPCQCQPQRRPTSFICDESTAECVSDGTYEARLVPVSDTCLTCDGSSEFCDDDVAYFPQYNPACCHDMSTSSGSCVGCSSEGWCNVTHYEL